MFKGSSSTYDSTVNYTNDKNLLFSFMYKKGEACKASHIIDFARKSKKEFYLMMNDKLRGIDSGSCTEEILNC